MQALAEKALEKLRFKRSKEISAERYLATLSDIDRQRVAGLVGAFESSIIRLQGAKVGIIAVGSSVKPEKERRHPTRDIDLRIVSSHPYTNPQRQQVIEETVSVVEEYARTQVDYKHNPHYTEVHQGPFFLNYDDKSPSFIIQGREGSLPLHVSISSHPDDTLEFHLAEEKRQDQHFSVLAVINSNSQ